jgi:hypothetical protein
MFQTYIQQVLRFPSVFPRLICFIYFFILAPRSGRDVVLHFEQI